MKWILAILFLGLVGSPDRSFADESGAQRIVTLDAFWSGISRSVREGDFAAYAASCHPEGVLVSGTKKSSSSLSEALARWKKEFIATQSGKMKANVEFRFSQRFGDETTAHETGIFLYSSSELDGKPKQEYIHFEILLVKKDGHWLTLMEYQKSQATQKEWDLLGHGS
jgi:hypothetical protein